MNLTKQMVLSTHHYYDDQAVITNHAEVDQVENQTGGDFFKEYYVIDEIRYSEPPIYTLFDDDEMSLEDLVKRATCFAIMDGVGDFFLNKRMFINAACNFSSWSSLRLPKRKKRVEFY
jgi:hypothetical protein